MSGCGCLNICTVVHSNFRQEHENRELVGEKDLQR